MGIRFYTLGLTLLVECCKLGGHHRNFDNFPSFYSNEPNQWWGSIGFCIRIYVPYDVTYEASENDEISIIAIGFNTNVPNYMNNLDVIIYGHHMKYVNDEISAIATAFMTNGPKYRVNIGNIYF